MSSIQETRRIVQELSLQYGVPDYITIPIMQGESSENPLALHLSGTEYSQGLYQINTIANPQYRGVNLIDPKTNAEIAIRDFLAPAWTKVQGIPGLSPEQQAAEVWRTGLKPAWSPALETRIAGFVQAFLGEGVAVAPPPVNPLNPLDPRPDTSMSMMQRGVRLGLLGLVVLVGVGSLWQIIPGKKGG